MSEILFHYHKVHPATWVYLSSLLAIGLFFKFNRFWSVRNVDLMLVILLAPGLLLVHFASANRLAAEAEFRSRGLPPPNTASVADELGSALNSASLASGAGGAAGGEEGATDVAASQPNTAVVKTVDNIPPEQTLANDALERRFNESVISERRGYIWLFITGGFLLLRLLIDPTMVRRPLLEPNLSTGGLAFIGISLFVFLMANVMTGTPTKDDLQGPKGATDILHRRDVRDSDSLKRHGPGYALLNMLPTIPTIALQKPGDGGANMRYVTAAKVMAILSHLAVAIGIVAIGYRHFNNMQTGIGVATLYLMLPYTSVMTGRLDHVLPAALLVWAVLCYRQPLLAGMFIGLAAGVVYYPMFLLPLWLSFYWRRGLGRFTAGVVSMLAIMVISLIFVSTDQASFTEKVGQMFGIWIPRMSGLEGMWGLGSWDAIYRWPVLFLFLMLSLTLALWPAQKNLGTLMSCSAAVMVATQFWHGYGGGLMMAWYLPLTLLTIFRPNLEDRVALSVLGHGFFFMRRHVRPIDRAA